MKSYYIARDAQQSGPFSEQEIKDRINSGQIRPSDYCWCAGMSGWKSAGSVFNMGTIYTPPPMPASPPVTSREIPMATLYEAILGEKNRRYYLNKFRQFDEPSPGSRVSWNGAAFIFTGLWALYRKMYGWFFAFWGVVAVANIFKVAGSTGGAVISFGACVAFAIFANSLYHRSIRKKIAVAQLNIKDESKCLERLRKKGGVLTWVIWVFLAMLILGLLMAIIIPALVHSGTLPSPKDQAVTREATIQADAPDAPASSKEEDPDTDSLLARAIAGDAKAQCKLGVMYRDAHGVERDYKEALKWIRKSAEQGYADGQLTLSTMYAMGYGVERTPAEARKWLYRAAEAGSSRAQCTLGWMLEGVNSFKEATKWYRKAAEQGDADAQFKLACIYFRGDLPQDSKETMKWMRRAAEQGVVEAQPALAISYEIGDGVLQSTLEAYAWAIVAASNGNRSMLDRYETRSDMKPLRLKAQARAKEIAAEIERKKR